MVEARTTTYQYEPDFAARQSILWSIAWLVGGATITVIAAIITLKPTLSQGFGFLSPALITAASHNAIVFGWLATVGFAAIFALLPRIAGVQLHNEVLGSVTTVTWSAVLTLGIIFVLLGVSQGRPFAELPLGADVALALLLVMVLFNAGVTVVRRREKTLYVTGWFLVAAALVAPLIYVVGNLPVFTGYVDVIANGFYINGIEVLWLLAIGLGIAHYVIPVETGNGLNSVTLARATFWSLFFAGGWAGARFYLFASLPAYAKTIAIAMTFVLLLPVLSAAANLFATARGRWELAVRSYGLRFAATGIGLAVAWIGLEALSAVPAVSRYVGLTVWGDGVRFLAIFGVLSSFGFALIYHAYPLMVGREWYSRPAASFHFWATQIAVAVGTLSILAAGAAQSSGASSGATVVDPLHVVTLLAFAVFAVAQYALAYNAIRTSRSGAYVDLIARSPATVASS